MRKSVYGNILSFKLNFKINEKSNKQTKNWSQSNRANAEADEDKLRYSIDPTWYGELPRTYFYDADHQITPLSGKISNSFLDTWLKK